MCNLAHKCLLVEVVLLFMCIHFSVPKEELETHDAVCGQAKCSTRGEGIHWHIKHSTRDIPVAFNEVQCDEESAFPARNGSEFIHNELTPSRTRAVSIQEGDGIRLFLETDGAQNISTQHKIALYTSTTQAMSSCNSSGMTSLGELLPSRNVTLTPAHLIQGYVLIIGDCHVHDTVFYQCFRANISVKTYRCAKGISDHPCSKKGDCLTNSTQMAYTCTCCPGYIGPFCEELDGCYTNPCKNGGFCIDISEGHHGDTYQCLCPYGYSGKTCEQITNKCDSQPCKNNGSCVGNQTAYTCSCAAGFAGANCETNINECASSPCIHGICVDGDDGYQCFCSPGYGGRNCQFEYKECDSSPCINGGSCLEKVGTYVCQCGPGYTGNRCQIKVDLCLSNPCPTVKRCMDRGSNFSCECKTGFTGPDCETKFNVCDPNPCLNGGTCWNTLSTIFCACKSGFNGDRCQGIDFDVFHLDPLPTMAEDHSIGLEQIGIHHLDHLHNIYIAAGTLASAFLIVLLIVGVCHCRVHKTYQRFAFCLPSNCSDETDCKRDGHRIKFSMENDMRVHPRPSLDTLYESSGLDFADNLDAPLINIAVKS